MKLLTTIIFLTFLCFKLQAQSCSTAGQLPSTAFPVCGTSTFHQTTVPTCQTHSLYVPGCTGDGAAYGDKNPYWYKFTCYQSGSLGFLVTPKDLGDDYDWQLYDITGHDPNDVFTDNSLIVTGNWAGTFGKTGASTDGTPTIQCASDPSANKNSYSSMPNLIAGHTYLLLVSHYTDSQSGYDLSFGGGSAVITDTTLPRLKTAEANCGGDVVRIKLAKHIICSSLASDASDFYITPGNIPITGVKGIGCDVGFDTDSIEMQLGSYLDPGTYTLNIKKGTDGNTLLDYCDNPVSTSDNVSFTVFPHLPTPMDSMELVQCSPQTLKLLFRKPMSCSSVAADGSDFMVTGSYPIAVTSASGSCNGGSTTSKEIVINLSAPIQQKGSFNLVLKKGSDGNTILDECGAETPAGSSLLFSVKDTVNADFTYKINYGCATDTVYFNHPGNGGVNSWQWDLDENKTSTLQNPTALYRIFNQKNVSLIVSNGFCADTSYQTVLLDNYIKADFSVFEDNCPNELINFTNNSQGNRIMSYSWAFGDGGTASIQTPSHTYTGPLTTRTYIVTCTITDSAGCQSTAQKTIKIYSSCYLAVPTGFTPNNDGLNDYLRVLNAVKVEQLDFKVYNRWGQLMFQTQDWKHGWDGTFKGLQQPSGVYVWFLRYKDRDTHQWREMKGTAALIR